MRIIVIFFAVFITVGFFFILAFLWDAYFSSPSKNALEISVTVQEGEGVSEIVSTLKTNGLVQSPLLFKGYVWLTKTQSDFQPGTFLLQPGMSYVSLLKVLTVVSSQEIGVTIPEGFTLRQIGERLQEKGLVTLEEWFSVVGNPAVDYRIFSTLQKPKNFSGVFPFLASKPDYISLEGYLFPDTYRFFTKSTAEEIVFKMLENFEKKFTKEMQQQIEKDGRTIFDTVRLASLIEKEVHTDPDRALVGDLFLRRLQAGIPLQADSSVNYVTGKNDPSVFNEDRETDSLWNTYRFPGLPLGPISNPGLAALQAAVFPQANGYWYFLTDSEGNVHYAKTNDEQNEHKEKYLK